MKFRLISYNIHKGFNHLGTDFVLHQTKVLLQESQTDLLLLQEVVGENKNHSLKFDHWPKESQFEFLADSHWPHFSYGKNAIYPERHHGNAILSKFPILHSENTNLTINKIEMRGLLHCIIQPLAEKQIHLLNVHLDLLHGSRMQQLHQIARYIKVHIAPDQPVILAGDFNDWSQKLTPHFLHLLNLQEAFQSLTGTHAKSFPAPFPFLKLDRIYYRFLRPISVQVLDHKPWSSLSDHLPISCEFELS